MTNNKIAPANTYGISSNTMTNTYPPRNDQGYATFSTRDKNYTTPKKPSNQPQIQEPPHSATRIQSAQINAENKG